MIPSLSESRWKRKILIVEDEGDLRALLREHFEGIGYYVETAGRRPTATRGSRERSGCLPT